MEFTSVFKPSRFYRGRSPDFLGGRLEGGSVAGPGELWWVCLKRILPRCRVTPCRPNNTLSVFGMRFPPRLESGCALCLETSGQAVKPRSGRHWEAIQFLYVGPARTSWKHTGDLEETGQVSVWCEVQGKQNCLPKLGQRDRTHLNAQQRGIGRKLRGTPRQQDSGLPLKNGRLEESP